jgi:protein-disulfide isomerase
LAQAPALGSNPATARLNIAGAPTLGRADAPVTIVEFSDFECPFCRRFNKSTWPEIKRDYVDTGKVRYVFLDFPLEQMHSKARKAAEAAHCAAEQGKFWEMHDILLEQSVSLDVRQYPEYARQLKLDTVAFDLCLGSGRQSAKINGGLISGRSVGINATPSFIIARTDGGNILGGGVMITGAQSYDRYRDAIEQALAAR